MPTPLGAGTCTGLPTQCDLDHADKISTSAQEYPMQQAHSWDCHSILFMIPHDVIGLCLPVERP